MLIGALDPAKTMHVQDATPTRQPGVRRPWVEFLRREVSIHDREDTRPRIFRLTRLLAHGGMHSSSERAKGSLQKAILVAEVMGDQSNRYTSATGYLRQCSSCQPAFRQAVDGDVNQLLATRIIATMQTGHIRAPRRTCYGWTKALLLMADRRVFF